MSESAEMKSINPPESGCRRGWSVTEVERLMAAMKREEVNLLDWADDSGLSLRLDRSATPQAVRPEPSRPAGSAAAATAAALPPGPPAPAAQSPAEARADGGLSEPAAAAPAEPAAEPGNWVCAPVVGVFFAGGSPEARPYVEVGDPVKPGDVLCIIEAMKLMNEVNSDQSGTVAEIVVENGQKVEYGQKLMRIVSDDGGQ
ncbi:MAG: acetyl-CoA carboxylase biotin carboxyl carrier protein [Oscillospiraceae bacterium]|nr:acetyl-CoA carboxylase biotin carboxyl carrier protein [Oscillospiraceae bacterium]MDD4368527.1 acetyl-CoA carboxylase biotin carboxyl carrier protein [Oscillospiraceae bacterium]